MASTEVAARARLFALMLARYPNTRLDAPELTLEAWISDTAHLPLDELRACIDYAVANDPTGFVPPSSKVLDAFVKRRTDRIDAVPIGNPCSLEQLRLTVAHRARVEMWRLREHHVDRLQLGPAAPLVAGLLEKMSARSAGEP